MLKAKFVFKRLLNKVRKNLLNAAYYNIFARVSMEFPRLRNGSFLRIIIFHEIIDEGYDIKLKVPKIIQSNNMSANYGSFISRANSRFSTHQKSAV